MPSSSEIAQQILTTLKVVDPDISAEPVTVEGKIINTVADAIAGANVDTFKASYAFDIDTKFGTDLDRFVAMFGWGRQSGTRAQGTVTFSRATTASSDITILAGTQVVKPATSVTPQVNYYTTATVVLPQGATSVDAPIEAAVIGEAGNAAAGTINTIVSTTTQISSVINANSTSGGSDQETDAQLKIRFKNQILRNLSGTQDMFLALAVATNFTNKANIIGPISRFIEYLQVPLNSTTLTSQNPYGKYTYNFDYFLTDGNFLNETFYSPSTHFTFSATTPPTLTVIDTTTLAPNKVVLLEYAYCSQHSRNDPANGIANFIDVYVSGQDATTATESVQFPTASANFNNTTNSIYYYKNFVRDQTDATPTIGNRFQSLLWQPVTTIPSSITINNSTYFLNTDYWLVRDVTVLQGSRRARNGIEWAAGVASTIDAMASQEFIIAYTFDKLPLAINALMDAHKQVASDVLVHRANLRYFVANFIVMYQPGFSKFSVDTSLTAAITDFFSKQQFGAVIQISDILEIAHEVNGVDNIRLSLPADGGSYGIQEVAPNGVTPLGTPYLNDFTLLDSDLPVLSTLNATLRSQNTFGGIG